MISREYDGKKPKIGDRAFVAENATLVGDVEVGNDCSIWYGAVLRADVNLIRIGSRSNIQDGCLLHVTNGMWSTIIAEEVTMGHGVIAHGCTIKRGALIGMGATILDGAVIGEEAMVGAGALVAEGQHVPPRTLVIGVPARIKRQLTDAEIAKLAESWKNYVAYKEKYLALG